MAATTAEKDWSQFPENDNPFFTAETMDHETMARWMLEQQEDEPEAN